MSNFKQGDSWIGSSAEWLTLKQLRCFRNMSQTVCDITVHQGHLNTYQLNCTYSNCTYLTCRCITTAVRGKLVAAVEHVVPRYVQVVHSRHCCNQPLSAVQLLACVQGGLTNNIGQNKGPSCSVLYVGHHKEPRARTYINHSRQLPGLHLDPAEPTSACAWGRAYAPCILHNHLQLLCNVGCMGVVCSSPRSAVSALLVINYKRCQAKDNSGELNQELDDTLQWVEHQAFQTQQKVRHSLLLSLWHAIQAC